MLTLVDIAASLEVISDVAGAVGGFIMLAPTSRLLDARHELLRVRAKLDAHRRAAGAPDLSDLSVLMNAAENKAQTYEPTDRLRLRQGLLLIVVSFVLKLGFHAIDKFFDADHQPCPPVCAPASQPQK